MKLGEYRIKQNIRQEVFADLLGVSVPTLARIEAAERENEQYRMSRWKAEPFLQALTQHFGRTVMMDDLDNIIIAHPKTGRPKKVQSEA